MVGTSARKPRRDRASAPTAPAQPAEAQQPLQVAVDGDLTPAPLHDAVIDAVVTALNEHVRSAGLQAALTIGGIVIDQMYGGDVEAWRSHGEKDASFRKLSMRCRDVEGGDGKLQMSASSLYRSVAIFALCQQLGVSGWKHLGVSHLRAVLGLPLDRQRKLLNTAEARAMTAEELEKKVAKLRKTDGAKRGRPALPAFVKSIGALGRLVAPAAGEPDPFGDLEQVDALSAEQAEALWKTVAGVKRKCEELQAKLAPKVAGGEAPDGH